MKSYTINLLRSKDRRTYVDALLSGQSFFINEYVEGVDATIMSEEQLQTCFNYKSAFRRYGRDLRKGEVGCTLSHRKCYDLLLQSTCHSVAVFEDDISFSQLSEQVLKEAEYFINIIERPCILLLSGGYWYKKTKCFMGEYRLADVYSAYYTHSYLINRKAANILLHHEADYLADDWNLIREQGIKVVAIHPHLIGQKDMGSLIYTENRGIVKKNLDFTQKYRAYKIGVIKKIMKAIGHYEQEKH